MAFAHGWLGWRTRRRCVGTACCWLAGRPWRAGTGAFAARRAAKIALWAIRTRLVAEIGALAPADTTLASFATAFTAAAFAACARAKAALATLVAAFAAIFPVRTRCEAALLAVAATFAAAFATVFAVRTWAEAALDALAARARLASRTWAGGTRTVRTSGTLSAIPLRTRRLGRRCSRFSLGFEG